MTNKFIDSKVNEALGSTLYLCSDSTGPSEVAEAFIDALEILSNAGIIEESVVQTIFDSCMRNPTYRYGRSAKG